MLIFFEVVSAHTSKGLKGASSTRLIILVGGMERFGEAEEKDEVVDEEPLRRELLE